MIKGIFPALKPTLNLDFADTKTLDPRIEFTRATAATYYDGKTFAKAEENLFTYSQEFDNAAWLKSNTIVTANSTVAPDGTATADTLSGGAGTALKYLSPYDTNSTISNAAVAFSIYAKEGTHRYIQLSISGDATKYVNFDLNGSGSYAANGAGVTAIINTAANGFLRCVVMMTTHSSTSRVYVTLQDSISAVREGTTSSTGNVYIWGAQIELRSSVTAYTPTTTQPITNYIPVLLTAPAGVARFDHNPVTGESLGLLIEEQRANLPTYSEQFDNAAWTKAGASISANQTISPGGIVSADMLIEDTSNGRHFTGVTAPISHAAGAVTGSIFVKKHSKRYVQISVVQSASDSFSAIVDLDTATITSTRSQNGTYSQSYTGGLVTPVGNGWYRLSIFGTTTATASFLNFGHSDVSTFGVATLAFQSVSYTGDGYSKTALWGAQLEAGAFATSYIKTEASQVTRNADDTKMTGANFSSWYRQSEGGFLMCARSEGSGNNGRVQIDDGTALNRLIVSANVAAATEQFVIVGNVTQATLNVGTFPSPADIKSALAYKVNNFAGVANGGSIASDSSGVVPLVTTMRIGANQSATYGRSWYKRIAYYPARLTNAQWQALTA